MADGSFKSLEQVAQEAASRSADTIEQIENYIKRSSPAMNQKEQDSVRYWTLRMVVQDLVKEQRRIEKDNE